MINVVVLLFIFWFVLSMAWWFIIYKQKYHFVLFFIFIIRYVSLLQNYLINFAKLLYIQTRITEKKSGCSKEVLSIRFQITPQLIVNIELNRFYHSLKVLTPLTNIKFFNIYILFRSKYKQNILNFDQNISKYPNLSKILHPISSHEVNFLMV